MADKDIDKPEQNTLGAKFKRAGKATKETTGEFFRNWGHNITLGNKVKFVFIPTLAMSAAMMGSAAFNVATDIDPTIDPTLQDHTTPLHQAFDATPSYQETTLENGQIQSVFAPSENPSVSVIQYGSEFFALIEHQGQFTLYSYDEGDEAFVRLENETVALRYINNIAGELDSQSQLLGQFNNPLSGQNVYSVDGNLSVPYSIDKDNGGMDVVRFGDVEQLNMNAEELFEYRVNASKFWAHAASEIENGNYNTSLEGIEAIEDMDQFDMFNNLMDGYNIGLGLIYLTLFGGGAALAVGQTAAGGRRKRKDKKGPKNNF